LPASDERLNRVTGFLELLGVLLVLTSAGWWVVTLAGVPAGLLSAALLSWLASWLLQGARLPHRRRPDRRNTR
jgi:hypothetical protein